MSESDKVVTRETERMWDEGASGLQTLSKMEKDLIGQECKERKQRRLDG